MIGTRNQPTPIEEIRMLSNRKFQVAVFAVIAVLAIFTISMMPAARRQSFTNANDQIELRRAHQYAAAAAASYDQVEQLRAQRYAAPATAAYGDAELQRAERYAASR
jgi:hypothetical protein